MQTEHAPFVAQSEAEQHASEASSHTWVAEQAYPHCEHFSALRHPVLHAR
jgi:hypothetical protein